jgi:tetratricopeptide (TPR) repeat protein
MTDADLLRAGISAARAGDSGKAAALLAQVIRADPNSEAGWFWLGLVCQTAEQRRYCFKRVLALNPSNAQARQLLNATAPASSSPLDSAKLSSTHPPTAFTFPPAGEAPVAIPSAPATSPRVDPAAPTPTASEAVSTPQPPPTSLAPGETPVSAPASPSPVAQRSPQERPASARKRRSTTQKMLVTILGVLLAILLCGGALGYLIISNQLGPLADWVAAAIWTPTPRPTASLTPSITPSFTPTYTPTLTHTPTPTQLPSRTPTSTITPTMDEAARAMQVEILSGQAKLLMREDKYEEAIAEWGQVISLTPGNAEAYYQRASCYLELNHNQHFHDVYLDNLNNALADLDQAIALDPMKGDYYYARYQIYTDLSAEEMYHVDEISLMEVALENVRVANQLGNSEEYSERDPAFVLYDLGRCEEGMAETRQLIDAQGSNAPPSAGLNSALADGYLCLGQLDKALEYLNKAIELAPISSRIWGKALILYYMGRLDDALAVLDDDIAKNPNYSGYRYFLRATIYAEQGKLDEAEADIEFGYGQTWERFGFLSYAKGRLALARGDQATALEEFQTAEATMGYFYGPLVKRIQREIASLGGKPLKITPRAIVATSIPTPVITATPAATSTFVYWSTPTTTLQPPQSATTVTYDVYYSRVDWINTVGGSIETEDFEKDGSDYGELFFPYKTGNGFILEGGSSAQIFRDASLLTSGILLHFRDWSGGLSLTFPGYTYVSAFGFDYRAREPWFLTVGNSVITMPHGRSGFIGIVIHSGDLNKFILSCTSNAQGGLSVDNISYVKK